MKHPVTLPDLEDALSRARCVLPSTTTFAATFYTVEGTERTFWRVRLRGRAVLVERDQSVNSEVREITKGVFLLSDVERVAAMLSLCPV